MRIMMTLAAAALSHGLAYGACPPRAELDALKAAKWEVAADPARQVLAAAMLDCLANPDPVVRDQLGFEALQVWMRTKKIDVPTLHAMRSTLLTRLKTADATGFAQPFSALALAEVVRADRVQPFLTAAQRGEIVDAASAYLSGVRDYRGFDQKEGWRHGVAHGADLMLQLALNPAIGAAEQRIMIGAISAQLTQASGSGHFFHYGEGERLMAPVFFLARRAMLDAAEWDSWFAVAAAPPGPPVTQASLAHRHNLKGFLLPLYVSLAESKDAAQRERLLPIVTKALRQLD